MNTLAAADLDVSAAMLAKALRELEMHITPGEVTMLEAAQSAWEKYAKAEAECAASHAQGGTIYPLLYLSELERLTVARIADVRARIELQKTLFN